MTLTALLLLVSLCLTAAIDCGNNEIACSNGEKCIPQRFICDFRNDCTDESDEDKGLCQAWRNGMGSKDGFVECTKNGTTRNVEISEYCTYENLGCEESLDRRICLMLEGQRLDKLSNFILPTNASECLSRQIACSNGEKCIPQQYICDGDNDCTDASDEDEELCRAWQGGNCKSKSEAKCFWQGMTTCLDVVAYCHFENPECDGSLDPRICPMLKSKKLDKLSNINVTLSTHIQGRNANSSKGSCPPQYTLVGDQCLSVVYTSTMGWADARTFCKVLGGDLWTFKNISQFADTVKYLQKKELSFSFWIGGSVSNDSEGWTWIDGSPMRMGTPFWSTRYSTECVNRNVRTDRQDSSCLHYYQSPDGLPSGECASLSHQHSFYLADEHCIRKMTPLCVYQF